MKKDELIQRLTEVRGNPEIWLEVGTNHLEEDNYQVFDVADHIYIDEAGDLIIRSVDAYGLATDYEEEEEDTP